MRAIDEPLTLSMIRRRQEVLDAQEIFPSRRGLWDREVHPELLHQQPRRRIFWPRVRNLEEVPTRIIVV